LEPDLVLVGALLLRRAIVVGRVSLEEVLVLMAAMALSVEGLK
jgi:hypothetical protein